MIKFKEVSVGDRVGFSNCVIVNLEHSKTNLERLKYLVKLALLGYPDITVKIRQVCDPMAKPIPNEYSFWFEKIRDADIVRGVFMGYKMGINEER